jgi:tetratricopeptide (TPR) repeat protein
MKKKQKESWNILMKAWNEGKTACRLHYARRYAAAYPDDMNGWIALADILGGIALYKDALKALGKSLKLCPKEKVYHIFAQMGHLYSEKCDLKKAERWYRKAVAEHSRQENLIFLGACLAKQGRLQEAKAFYQQAVQTKPKTADEAYFNLGLISRAEDNYIVALDYFNKAIEIDPDYEAAKCERKDIQELIEIIEADNTLLHATRE